MFLKSLDEAGVAGPAAALGVWTAATLDVGQTLWRRMGRPLGRRAGAGSSSQRQAVRLITSDIRAAWRSLLRQRFAGAWSSHARPRHCATSPSSASSTASSFGRSRFPSRTGSSTSTRPRRAGTSTGRHQLSRLRPVARRASGCSRRSPYYDTRRFNRRRRQRGADRGRAGHPRLRRVLGVQPILGRFFTAEEDRPKAPPVVVISDGLWQERFGADPTCSARRCGWTASPRTIVGVMPRVPTSRVGAAVGAAGRRPGQTARATAGRHRPAEAGRHRRDRPRRICSARSSRSGTRATRTESSALRAPCATSSRATSARRALALGAAVGLLLVVACANVASLMLARALAPARDGDPARRRRQPRAAAAPAVGREPAPRARRRRAGSALGYWALARWSGPPPTRSRGGPPSASTPASWRSRRPDGGHAVLFGWAPAFHAAARRPAPAMHGRTPGRPPRRADGGRCGCWSAPSSRSPRSCWSAAGCSRPTIASGRSTRVRAEHVLTFGVYLPGATIRTKQAVAFWNRLSDSARSRASRPAGLITCAPLGCHWGNFFEVEGAAAARRRTRPGQLLRHASLDISSDGHPAGAGGSSSLRTPPASQGRRGGRQRDVRASSGPGATPSAAASRAQRPRHPGSRFRRRRRRQALRARAADAAGVYFPVTARPVDSLTVALERRAIPGVAWPGRERPSRARSGLPLFQVRTMDRRCALDGRRARVFVAARCVRALALLLALGGTYGVTCYRRRSGRARWASGSLWARTADILRAVLSGSVLLASTSIGVGLLASLSAQDAGQPALRRVAPQRRGPSAPRRPCWSWPPSWPTSGPRGVRRRVDPVGLLRSDVGARPVHPARNNMCRRLVPTSG